MVPHRRLSTRPERDRGPASPILIVRQKSVAVDLEQPRLALARRATLTLANTSRHLQLLRRAGLVEGRRDGKRVYYRLAGDDVVVGLLAAQRIATTISASADRKRWSKGCLADRFA